MLFIADICERYTTNVARFFARLASSGAETIRRALDRLRAWFDRNEFMAVGKAFAAPAPQAAPSTGTGPAYECGDLAAKVVRGDRVAQRMGETSDVAAIVQARMPAMPMGVRSDVVVKWLASLASGERRQMPELLERLRKDKKVRVAELQMICAEALGEPPQHRKKAEHLEVLRRHFMPVERPRVPVGPDLQVHAG